MARSKLEDELVAQLRAAGLALVRERLVCPWRRWRSDLAVWHPQLHPSQILVEVQGVGPQGRHGGWGHHESDCEKFSTAAALGRRVLPVSGKMVRSGLALLLIEVALGLKGPEALQEAQDRVRSTRGRKPVRGTSGGRKRPARDKAALPDRVKRAAGL